MIGISSFYIVITIIRSIGGSGCFIWSSRTWDIMGNGNVVSETSENGSRLDGNIICNGAVVPEIAENGCPIGFSWVCSVGFSAKSGAIC